MRICLQALGCRLNQAEIELIGREAAMRGHEVVSTPADAEWTIINTCTVTHVAARKSRQAIRQLYRANPAGRIAVIGCYGETNRCQVQALAGVALVVSNLRKDDVLDLIAAGPITGNVADRLARERAALAHLPCERTRAFLKVQDGCENACAYCIVTAARGPARSVPPGTVLAQAQQRRGEGANEIVLSGVNIGSYGRDRGPTKVVPSEEGWTLARLVSAILDGCDVPRLRLSSVEPWDVTPELLSLWRDPRMCRQLHLPLQSGCEATLARMARRMSAAEYATLVSKARDEIPGLAITADVMVGFPGETDAEFAESVAFVQAQAFSRLHVFRFSARPGTPAATMPGQVPPQVAAARSQRMAAVGRSLARNFHESLVGQEVDVLFESLDDKARAEGTPIWEGLTDTYVRVRVAATGDLTNTLRRVRLTAADAYGAWGQLA